LQETRYGDFYIYAIGKGDRTFDVSYHLSEEEVSFTNSCPENALIRLAIIEAYRHHKEQVDKGGHPYIEHLSSVASRMDNVQGYVVGLLHDTVEDTDMTYERLNELFPDWVLMAVEAISRRKIPGGGKETDDSYMSRVINNEIATEVKISDMINNLDYSRISKGLPTKEEAERMGRYGKYLPILVRKYWDNKEDERDLGPVHTGKA
jgi:(p)ppGpp synthase/HD superfamily hydrolase